jgi:hypothetical protein
MTIAAVVKVTHIETIAAAASEIHKPPPAGGPEWPKTLATQLKSSSQKFFHCIH